jgi:hypothetical protein
MSLIIALLGVASIGLANTAPLAPRPLPSRGSDTTIAGALVDSVQISPDTVPVRRRPRAVEVSDAYALRLRLHRYASYTMIPLFAVQSVAGNQLYVADQSGSPRPGWARTTHKAGAAGLGVLFTVNTVTGLWNLWDSRHQETGRTRRLLHAGLLLASDAGFTYAGIKLSDDAKRSQAGREDHRRVAYISMGAALAGYGIMLFGDH